MPVTLDAITVIVPMLREWELVSKNSNNLSNYTLTVPYHVHSVQIVALTTAAAALLEIQHPDDDLATQGWQIDLGQPGPQTTTTVPSLVSSPDSSRSHSEPCCQRSAILSGANWSPNRSFHEGSDIAPARTGEITIGQAAALIDLSERQTRLLLSVLPPDSGLAQK